MRNRDLKTLYEGVYKKGEQKHYSKLLFAKHSVSPDKKAVINEINWKGKKVLDIGCGTGEFAYLAAKHKAAEVLGIDYSARAIAIASKLHPQKNLSFKCLSAENVTGRFDVITAIGTLEHFDKPFAALKRFRGMLRAGGSIIVVSPNWSNPRGYMLMTLKHLFDAKITLADLHYFTPLDFERWAKALGMKLVWRTIDYDWAMGKRLVRDLKRRIPNVLRDSKLPLDKKRIAIFIKWVNDEVTKIERPQKYSGAIGIYHFR